MLNQVILVGRITHDLEVKSLEDGKKVLSFIIAVRRAFKNMEGEYDTDFIKVTCWEGLATSISNYASKGAIVGIKGRLQVSKFNLDEEKQLNIIEIVAEKVSYIESAKN